MHTDQSLRETSRKWSRALLDAFILHTGLLLNKGLLEQVCSGTLYPVAFSSTAAVDGLYMPKSKGVYNSRVA